MNQKPGSYKKEFVVGMNREYFTSGSHEHPTFGLIPLISKSEFF
jgi:hypothetical protein